MDTNEKYIGWPDVEGQRHQELMETFGKLLAAVNAKNDLLADIWRGQMAHATKHILECIASAAEVTAKSLESRIEDMEGDLDEFAVHLNARLDSLATGEQVSNLDRNIRAEIKDAILLATPPLVPVPEADASLSGMGLCNSISKMPHYYQEGCQNWKPLTSTPPLVKPKSVPPPRRKKEKRK